MTTTAAITTTDQRVCAVCQTPCNPVFERIEVTVGVLPSKPSEINALTYSYTSSTQAVNMGTNPQTITVSFSIAQQLTATMTYAEAFQYSEKASFKVCTRTGCGNETVCVMAGRVHLHITQCVPTLKPLARTTHDCPAVCTQLGVPFVKEGSLEFGAQQTFTTTTTNTAQTTTTYTTALQQQIPPLTLQEVNASARADTITTRVPVTIKTYYTCDKVMMLHRHSTPCAISSVMCGGVPDMHTAFARMCCAVQRNCTRALRPHRLRAAPTALAA